MSAGGLRWARGLPSGRYRYMTARCLGCDWWSIPPVVERHVEGGACRRAPWAVAGGGGMLVAEGEHARVLALVPPQLKRLPRWSDRALRPLDRDRRMRDAVLAGTVLISPFPGVPARRWLEAAEAAVRCFGPTALDDALDRDRFSELEQTLGTAAGFVACPVCGDWVRETGLVSHQRASARCRWLVAHREVEAAWQQGWRDPWSLQPDVPATWSVLSRPRWRRRARLVEYPHWTAVLVWWRQDGGARQRREPGQPHKPTKPTGGLSR